MRFSNDFSMTAYSDAKNQDWLTLWIKGHAQMYGRKHLAASKTFQTLNETHFYQNELLVTLMGKCHYFYGSAQHAQNYLETAVLINPHNMDAVSCLSVVYEYNKKLQDLEKLTAKMTNIKEFNSDHWFVLGQCYYANGKLQKAAQFALKSISLNPLNIEVCFLLFFY